MPTTTRSRRRSSRPSRPSSSSGDDLRDKTRRGLAGQVRRGYSVGGRTYGYRTEPVVDSTRIHAHGQPVVLGYRHVVIPEEAQMVRRVFEEYANGRSPKAIVRDLNREGVRPPRGKNGWTWTALVGNPRLETGILNNPLYVGQHIWNRFRWEKDPETNRRVPRLRPRDDWTIREAPELHIVPQELWDRVKARQAKHAQSHARQGVRRGAPPKYLFSGLLRCRACGATYTMYNGGYYACSFHTNRGNAVCANSKVVRRARLGQRVLAAVQQEIFSPDAIAYLTHRVNEILQRLARGRSQQETSAQRRSLLAELARALKERTHIEQAIRRGLIGEITREMMAEVEGRIESLRTQLNALDRQDLSPVAVLPRAIQTGLQELGRVLERDVDRARDLLRELLGEIVLRPTPDRVVEELRGNVEGLLALEKAPRTGNSGSGGPLIKLQVIRVLVS